MDGRLDIVILQLFWLYILILYRLYSCAVIHAECGEYLGNHEKPAVWGINVAREDEVNIVYGITAVNTDT